MKSFRTIKTVFLAFFAAMVLTPVVTHAQDAREREILERLAMVDWGGFVRDGAHNVTVHWPPNAFPMVSEFESYTSVDMITPRSEVHSGIDMVAPKGNPVT